MTIVTNIESKDSEALRHPGCWKPKVSSLVLTTTTLAAAILVAATIAGCSNIRRGMSGSTIVGDLRSSKGLNASLPPLIGLDGKNVSLKLERPTLVHFFASWCSTCNDEMLALQEIARLSERSHFKVLFVAVEDALPALRAVAPQYQFPVYLDQGGRWKEQFHVNSLPKTILLNRDQQPILLRDPESGKMVREVVGPRVWSDEATAAFLENL